jgi:hypothetical protein
MKKHVRSIGITAIILTFLAMVAIAVILVPGSLGT